MVWLLLLSVTKLISRNLTARQHLNGIRSLIGGGTLVRALALSVLYLRETCPDASPKAISGSTSYLRV